MLRDLVPSLPEFTSINGVITLNTHRTWPSILKAREMEEEQGLTRWRCNRMEHGSHAEAHRVNWIKWGLLAPMKDFPRIT